MLHCVSVRSNLKRGNFSFLEPENLFKTFDFIDRFREVGKIGVVLTIRDRDENLLIVRLS